MRERRTLSLSALAAVPLFLVLLVAPAAAHHSGGPVCLGDPPPPNAEGPPEVKGFWEDIVDLEIQGIHAVHLPLTGKVLLWGGNGAGGPTKAKVYDPETGDITDTSLGYPGFCSGHTHLADGRVLIAGGTGRLGAYYSVLFDPQTLTASAPIPMNAGRFYPTLTILGDGRVFTASGSGGRAYKPEIFDPATGTWNLVPCERRAPCDERVRLHFYPRTSLTDDGRLFMTPASRKLYAYLYDLATGVWTPLPIGTETKGKMSPAPAVYYAPGRVLRAGTDVYARRDTAEASIVDFSDPDAATYRLTNPMTYSRNRVSLTLLADGTVLATGGTRRTPCAPPENDPNVYHPELWDPATEEWTVLGPMQVARVYHATALLLRDGSVLVAGSEPKDTTSQIFRPPYLYKGTPPTIASAPAVITPGESFEVFTPDAPNITNVNLIRLGAATHAYDQAQRIVRLWFTAGIDRLTVEAPAAGYDAPPGYYMLFLISDQGVPSVAEYVRVDAPPPW